MRTTAAAKRSLSKKLENYAQSPVRENILLVVASAPATARTKGV
jgi:hypothetical protein